MTGLLDEPQQEQSGLLKFLTSPEFNGFSQGLLAAGNSNQPVSFMQALGAGGAGVQQGKEKARAKEIEEMLLKLKVHSAMKGSASEEKIRRLQETLGIDEKTAVGIADGAIKVVTDPVSGEHKIINLGTGTGSPIGSQPANPVSPQINQPSANTPEQRTSLYELSEKTAGPLPAIKRAASVPAGWLGMDVGGEEIQAGTTMQNAQNELISALQFNPKYAEGERNNLKKEISIEPKILDSDITLQNRMQSVGGSIKKRLVDAERDAADPSLPAETRRMAAHNASKYRNFLPLLDAPEGNRQGGKRSLDEIFR